MHFKVIAWGFVQEEKELSNVLKEETVSIVPNSKCVNEPPNNLRKYITPDKICGVYTNNGKYHKNEIIL